MSDQSKAPMTPEILEERMIEFAVRVISVANRLSASFAGKHIAAQMVRSGTSPAPNYAEARSAESRADFIHKLRIVVKELNETSVWLRIVGKSSLVKPSLLEALLAECDELKRIVGASLRTARLRAAR
jgi:four helix bundle protein